jgi:hypothetical protein
MPQATSIPGYDYASRSLPSSPVSLEELKFLEQAAGFTEEDAQWLQKAGAILSPQAEQIVDSWRKVIASQPHLARFFFGPDGKPDEAYKAAVKKRFVRWVIDACERPHDQDWLNYQEEIGQRHTPARKNLTDHSQTSPVVSLRYLIAFSAVAVTTIREFLEKGGQGPEDIHKMQDAWTKSMFLHVALWSRPYVTECLW